MKRIKHTEAYKCRLYGALCRLRKLSYRLCLVSFIAHIRYGISMFVVRWRRTCIDTPVNIFSHLIQQIHLPSEDFDCDDEVYFRKQSWFACTNIHYYPSRSEPSQSDQTGWMLATKTHRTAQAVRVQIPNKDNVFSLSLTKKRTHSIIFFLLQITFGTSNKCCGSQQAAHQPFWNTWCSITANRNSQAGRPRKIKTTKYIQNQKRKILKLDTKN